MPVGAGDITLKEADVVLALKNLQSSKGVGGQPGFTQAGKQASKQSNFGAALRKESRYWETSNQDPSPGRLREAQKRSGRQSGQARVFCQLAQLGE